jgi:hypothetical protein
LSFETTFDDEYEIHYRDKTVQEIMKALCQVSGRWWMVDDLDQVWMLPLGDTMGIDSIPRGKILSLKRKAIKAEEPTINVDRYEEDDGGKITSWGIKLRKNEVDAIQRAYKDKYGGEKIETRVSVLETTPGLMKTTEYGNVIRSEEGLSEDVHDFVLEEY